MASEAALVRLLRRDRAITLAGLAVLCVLSWCYLAIGAGLGMSAWEMTTLALFPHRQGTYLLPRAPAAWGLATWSLTIAMWWVMMIAMMTPSAAPAILLYARVHRYALERGDTSNVLAPTGVFAAGYLLVWLGFSVVATALHWAFERMGLVAAMMMGSRSVWLSGVVLMAAGLYQLSPLKNTCLAHCRAPMSLLAHQWRPHALGALRLGALHGAYCVGCCWLLMALLFVGGVMNLVWIGALAIIVLFEKALPAGHKIGRVVGLALMLWGLATFVVSRPHAP